MVTPVPGLLAFSAPIVERLVVLSVDLSIPAVCFRVSRYVLFTLAAALSLSMKGKTPSFPTLSMVAHRL
jgi:hypothetical protein